MIVALPVPPWEIETVFGAAVRLKLGGGGALTVMPIVVLLVNVPDVPVIVTVDVPRVAVALAVSVKVLVEVRGLVPNVAVTPLGRPATERVTLPLNPFSALRVIVVWPLLPCAIAML